MKTLRASRGSHGGCSKTGVFSRAARASWLVIAFAVLAIGGCRKDEGEKKTDDKAAAQSADKDSKARTAKAEDEGIEVPTEEDFEDTVQSQITGESDLKKELDDLEKQIGE